MKNQHWQSITKIKPTEMKASRRQAQNALHWMARIANSYLEADDKSRHIELLWNSKTRSIRTKQFLSQYSLELRLETLELQFCENDIPVPHTLSFQERTPAHVEAWFLIELLHRDIDREKFSKALPYVEAELMMGDSEEHEVEQYSDELTALNDCFCDSAEICAAVADNLKRNEDGFLVSTDMPVICWPQLFHLGIELDLQPGFGSLAIRMGLSAGDGLRPSPFFFTATRDEAEAGDFEASSILPVERIASENMSHDDVVSFLSKSILDCRKRLAN